MGNWLWKGSEEVTESTRDDTPSSSGQTSSQTCTFDDLIIKVGDAISDDGDLRSLGLKLGVKMHDITRALRTNWDGPLKTSNGNVMMLQNWAKKVKPSERLPSLRAALKRAGLLELEDICFTNSCSDDDEAMPSDIIKLREQLKSRYRKKFGQIKTSPVDSESRTWFQHIYVSLVLMLGSGGGKEELIDYDGLFKFIKTDTPKGFVTRLAFIGEAGVGKSTLFAKIALDWAEGKILQEINLLFLESFREIKDSGFFGDTVMDHFPDDSEIKGERVDEYIRKNQRKVLILLDGLDEAQIDIKKPNPNDAIVSILRGERFIDTPVIITTRPFGADQIKSIMKIHDHYTFGKVTGFTKENMATYIKNFFKDDSDSASSLIEFIDTNHVISEYMAPFPIFCCMLCTLWKTPSGREDIQTMETFSQLLKRLVFSLQELYSSKPNELEEGYGRRMKKASKCMEDIRCIAFEGLLVKQLIFDEKALDSCTEAAMIACEVGILSMEIRPAPLQIRESQRKLFIQEFSFPHKLLQEYIASLYLASLFHDDRQEFNRILADTLFEDYKEFRYVLYFTAAHGNGGEVGKSVLEALCKKVDDMEFIIQCAFECHDSEAIDPVRNLLKTKKHFSLTSSLSITAHVFTLDTIGKEVVRRSSSLGVSESFEDNASPSHVAAVGLFTLKNLRHLTIDRKRMDNEFYTGMSAAASQSKIEKLDHTDADPGSAVSSHYARGLCFMPNLRALFLDYAQLSDEFYSTIATEASKSKIEKLEHRNTDLGSAASSHFARGLCFMPNLRSLKLFCVKLSAEFYSTIATEASKSKIEDLKHIGGDLGSAASSHFARGLCFMPNLRSLHLNSVDLSDEFYSTIATEASKSKIEKLKHWNVDLGSAASSHYARGLCFMPKLLSLDINNVELSDEFYSAMASEASNSKIEDLKHIGGDLGSAASSHYARGLCFMPNLRSMDLVGVNLSDEFYSMMASEASKSKIEVLNHEDADLGSAASSHYARGLCSMPNLRSLNLDGVKLSDEFFSTMASEASKSKIETLSIAGVSMMTPLSLHSILALPCLQSLSLSKIRQVDTDDRETLTRPITPVDELCVDCEDVTTLWNLGLHTSCPRVNKLQLYWSAEEKVSTDTVTSDIVTVACSPFHHLTHLCLQGRMIPSKGTILNDPVSFCNKVITSCPRLTKLSINSFGLHNKKASEIIQLLKTHPHLTSIELNECGTNADLDPLISEVNGEGKLTVIVEHGFGFWSISNNVSTLEDDPHQTT